MASEASASWAVLWSCLPPLWLSAAALLGAQSGTGQLWPSHVPAVTCPLLSRATEWAAWQLARLEIGKTPPWAGSCLESSSHCARPGTLETEGEMGIPGQVPCWGVFLEEASEAVSEWSQRGLLQSRDVTVSYPDPTGNSRVWIASEICPNLKQRGWDVFIFKAFFFFFKLEDNCFTMLCWFLPCDNMNQELRFKLQHL